MIGMLAATITPAAAEEPGGTVTPCATRDICISVHEPGSTTSGKPGGKGETVAAKCIWQGKEIPCWDDELGWYSNATSCWYLLVSPKPAADDQRWGGRDPAAARSTRSVAGTGRARCRVTSSSPPHRPDRRRPTTW
ncbi:hypothetical protein ACFQ0T_07150 [Kitasatospora gansuensis]